MYRTKAETAVAGTAKEKPTIQLGPISRYHVKMLVAQRFHIYCESRGMVADQRMPYGFMKTFIQDNILWKAKQNALQGRQVRSWYKSWRISPSNEVAAVAGNTSKNVSEKNLLRSRAPVKDYERLRGAGAGPKYKVPLIRQALYDWWSSIRYAIDWKQLIANRRSRGKIIWPVFLAQPCV